MNSLSQNLPSKIHVIGAAGRSGKALVQALHACQTQLIALIRNERKWQATGFTDEARQINLDQVDLDPIDFNQNASISNSSVTNPENLKNALQDATHIVSTAHARYIPTILQAAPAQAQFVFLGSTRKFTQWPDAHGNGVLTGEKAFLESGRRGVILHPTMIYGTDGENNVQRLASLLKKLPFIPLPNGGKSLVQPIHQSDVTRAILHALAREFTEARSMVIAGNSPLSYREFIRLVLQAAQIPEKTVLPVPLSLLRSAAFITRFLPFLPTIEAAEIQRLAENKNFDISEMKKELGFTPMEFAEGIRLVHFD